jgi:hypothetical protein
MLAQSDTGSVVAKAVKRTLVTLSAAADQPWQRQQRPKTRLMCRCRMTTTSQQVNCVPQHGVENQQIWPSSQNLATEKLVQGGCRKCSPSNKEHPQNTSVHNFSNAERKMGMFVCQTQLLVMKTGFIIITHNEKTINGMASSVSPNRKKIQGADFCR